MTNSSSKTRQLVKIVSGMDTSDGAGVKLRRVIGTPECGHLDPFLMLDEFRNDNAGDYIAGFPDHPHRGFETVTYMKRGKMRHKDSVGNEGVLEDGAVQWMTAGSGIIHSEMPEQSDGLLWGYQLWVNLPAELKMTAPKYQDIPSEEIREVTRDGVNVRVIAGSFDGTDGPVEANVPVTYLDVTLAPSTSFSTDVPGGWTAFAYTYQGTVAAGDQGPGLEMGKLGIFDHEGGISLKSGPDGAGFLLLAGKPIEEPIVQLGPFVMNTREEVYQAASEFRSGQFLQH